MTDKPDVFLGGSFGRDPDGTLFWGAKGYIARSLKTYERVVGEPAKTTSSPLPERCYPEINTTSELDDNGRAKYQSLIGCLQWVVTLGHFDIACTVMTMSWFHVAPRVGHLELLGHIFRYLQKYLDGALRFHMDTPTHKHRFCPIKTNWDRSVYREPYEEIPDNAPVLMGQPVQQMMTFNANLEHCKVTGTKCFSHCPISFLCILIHCKKMIGSA